MSVLVVVRQRLLQIAARVDPTICQTHSARGVTIEGRILADDYAFLMAAAAESCGLTVEIGDDNRLSFVDRSVN